MNSYIYVFVREDISFAQKIVQAGHACHEAGKMLSHAEFKDVSSMVLLSAKDENDLENIARIIDRAGIDFHMFFEPDNNMGFSAICTRPIFTQRERNIFRQWDLFRHPS